MSLHDLTCNELIERSQKVGPILSELSCCHLDENRLKDYAERFRDIYRDGYRQRYSEILEMLKGIPSDDSDDGQDDEVEDRLEILSANLIELREYLRCNIETYGEAVYSGVFKLSDHVDIEIRRIRDRDSVFHELSRTGDNIVSLSKRAEELKKNLDEARVKAENLQMHMVAILGIFAAIVMAFAGGLDILSGAVSVSGESDLFNVVFVVILCGIIMFNIFAFLMHMILAIIDPQRCYDSRRYQEVNLRSGKARLSAWLDRFVGSRFIVSFNAVLLMAMVIDAILMVALA